MNQKRKTLKLLGTAWVTPTVIAASIPAHAQTTGAFCGGMEGVAGYWRFAYVDELHALFGLYLYPNGTAVDDGRNGGGSAKWSLNGTEIRVYNFEGIPNYVLLCKIDNSCEYVEGKELSSQSAFFGHKSDTPLP